LEDIKHELGSTFLGILMDDVLASLRQLEAEGTQPTKRNFIRVLFASVEGLAWLYREHVKSVAVDVGELSSEIEAALRDRTYLVSESGKVTSQPRYLSLVATIRITTRLAQRIDKTVEVDFGSEGWSALKATIELRNRLTHPKSQSDLEISPEDVARAWTGSLWLTRLVVETLTATQRELERYAIDFRDLADKLIAGDPKALAEYRAVLRASDD